MTGEVVPGDGQRDADAGLAVETPVGRDGQQRDGGHSQAQGPHHAASQQSGTRTEAQLAEREAEHQEAVGSDEADDEGRHLTGQQGQEAGKLTSPAVFPAHVVQNVVAPVTLVRHANHC